MFEKKMQTDALFGFYGNLLTDKQKEIMDLFCRLDYSLGEISEIMEISRQAVHDTVKRTTKTLEQYEEKLGLLSRFSNQQQALEFVYEMLLDYEANPRDEILKTIKSKIHLMLDDDSKDL